MQILGFLLLIACCLGLWSLLPAKAEEAAVAVKPATVEFPDQTANHDENHDGFPGRRVGGGSR